MTTGKSARDDSLRELLKSPLDDRPQRSIRWWPWAIGAVVIALAGFTAMAIGGGEGAEPGAPSTTTAEHTLTTVPAYPDVVQYGELVSDPDSGLMLLIGGGTRRTGARIDGLSLDTYAFDPVEEIWGRLEVSGNLQGRVGHAIAFDSSRRSVLVFGGHTSADLFTCSNSGLCAASAEGDTWLLDLNESTWSEVRAAGPEGRYGAAMAYDPISGRVILFGGATPSAHLRTNGFLDDTWAFEPTVNRWARVTPPVSPPPRGFHEMIYDAGSRRIILFGGLGDDPENTWAFDPATDSWESLGPDPLVERWGIGSVIDASGTIHAIGGGGLMARQTGAGSITEMRYSSEVWLGADGEWSRAEDLPGEVAGGAAAYDESRDLIVFYVFRVTALFDTQNGEWTFIDPPDTGESEE